MKTANQYEIRRTVVEHYYVSAQSKKEALEIIGNYGGPSKVIVKSEAVIKLKSSSV